MYVSTSGALVVVGTVVVGGRVLIRTLLAFGVYCTVVESMRAFGRNCNKCINNVRIQTYFKNMRNLPYIVPLKIFRAAEPILLGFEMRGLL